MKEKTIKITYKTPSGEIKIKDALYEVLHLLNSCWLINKNVKKEWSEGGAYHTFEICCRCCDTSTCDCNGRGCKKCAKNYCWDCCGLGRTDFTQVDYNLRDKEYQNKTKLIILCISSIQWFRLPIKYGKNEGVVYFQYCGKQVSFHDPQNKINCKSYKGEWSGVKNLKLPFPFIYK